MPIAKSNYLPLFAQLIGDSGRVDRWEVVQKDRVFSVSRFYEFRKLFQGQPTGPSVSVEIMPDEQLQHPVGSTTVVDFLILKLKSAGVVLS